MKTTAAALVAAATLSGALRSPADVIDISLPGTTLAMVLGNQFIVGDKMFSVGSGGFASASFNPSEIFISPVVNANPDTGEGFRLTGAFNDPPGGASSLFTLTYDVNLLPAAILGGHRISAADLRFNGFATGEGSESRINAGLTVESQSAGNVSVFAPGGAAGSSQLSGSAALNNLTALRMVATGLFTAGGETGTAGASFLDLSYGRVIVPAPAGAVAVLAGLSLARRRRRA